MKKPIARALAIATVATGAALAAPGAASAGTGYDVPNAIPKECTGRLQTVAEDRSYGQIFIKDGRITHEQDDGRFPFVPEQLIPVGAAGGPDDEHGNRQGNSTSFVTAPNGLMHSITHSYGSDAEGNATAEVVRDKTIGHGWTSTEDLTYGGRYVYRITTDGKMYRYTMADGELTGTTPVFTRGGVALRTVEHTRQVTWKGEKADVLLTNTTDGRLREYIVPVEDPSSWTARNLKTSTWGAYSQLSTSPCGEDGRVIVGRNDNGRIAAWYDRDATDLNGADISGDFTSLPALPASTSTHQ